MSNFDQGLKATKNYGRKWTKDKYVLFIVSSRYVGFVIQTFPDVVDS